MFYLALQPGMKRFREKFYGRRNESLRVHGRSLPVSWGLMGVTANAAGAFVLLRRELDDIGMVVNPAKTGSLPLKRHGPTAE